MKLFERPFCLGLLFILTATSCLLAQPITLDVDARDVVARQMVHSSMTIPVTGPKVTLAFPRWLPGYHAPDGKTNNLVNLHVKSGDRPMHWRRDPIELDQIHVDLPGGVNSIQVDFDFILKDDDVGLDVAALEWHNFAMYPVPSKADDLRIKASMQLPRGWEYATALKPESGVKTQKGHPHFEEVSFYTLLDSPVFAGLHCTRYPLGQVNETDHLMVVFGDSDESTQADDETKAAQKRLPAEAFALFGSQHYDSYVWLVGLSDALGWAGLEHHECSDNRMGADALSDEADKRMFTYLLSHEYVHSWCGKYRRPSGMAREDYQQPRETELIWVYEGLTEYYGMVLAARSGAWTTENFLEAIADNACQMAMTSGRTWRSLRDTSVDAPKMYQQDGGYGSLRRGTDFYTEGALLWLEIDVTIRNLTHGTKSLDDFARLFFGGEGGMATVKPYTFDDVIDALNSIAPNDWRSFINQRLDSNDPKPIWGGIVNGGYKLDFTDEPSTMTQTFESCWDYADVRASIGIQYDPTGGQINDIVSESPAYKAGLPINGTIIAVNGMTYSDERLREAIDESKEKPIELIVSSRDTVRVFKLDYAGGSRYPVLKRDESKADRLSEIAHPLTWQREE